MENIKDKVRKEERISVEEALSLYENAELFELGSLALEVRRRKNGDLVYYNRNFHIEPTNICRFNCRFCSYRKHSGDQESWDMSLEDVERYVRSHYREGVTEVHLVGGVHPQHDIEHYYNIIRPVRKNIPADVAIKAFSAVEHIAVAEQAGMSFEDGLKYLMEAGMNTITGGGAEILDDEIRKVICPDKPNSEKWLALHEAAQKLGMKTGATMLYGHVESMEDRLKHMERIRSLQDKTGGFSSFIPLKFRSKNNSMEHLGECSIVEDLKTLAISRIFLDNIDHIKAYTPMYGNRTSQMALLFGADDLDGTVEDTTKIYSMAGVGETAGGETALQRMATEAGFRAVERDTFYNIID